MRKSDKSTNYPKDVRAVAAKLRARYRDFAHYNQKDSFRELIYILCSTMTQEAVYRRTFRDLIARASTPRAIKELGLSRLTKILEPGGLGRKKAKLLMRLVAHLESKLQSKTLRTLRLWPDEQLEGFLCALPGVGKKVARCVMLYSYDRQVFPIDTHCWRVIRRLGWVRSSDGICTPRDMDRVQERIPPELRYSLHVNMVSLGRDTCRSRQPNCAACTLKSLCPARGVKRRF